MVGVSPSTPGEVPRSSRDDAQALAAVHAAIRCHLRNHALRTLPCNSGGADRDLAFARAHKKSCASADNLPPTSPASTTSLALPPSLTRSGKVRSFLVGASCKATPPVRLAPLSWHATTTQCGNRGCVNSQPDSPEQWQSVGDDLRASCHPDDPESPSRVLGLHPPCNSCRGTCGPVVAKNVGETATPAHTC